jgi:hypothetical protein
MIDQATLQAATAKLLLDSMSAEDKDALLSKALTTVLTPARSAYSSEATPLQAAFDHAAKVAAAKQVGEYFQTPEVQARVKVFVAEAMEKAFTDDFVQKLATKMCDALWAER